MNPSHEYEDPRVRPAVVGTQGSSSPETRLCLRIATNDPRQKGLAAMRRLGSHPNSGDVSARTRQMPSVKAPRRTFADHPRHAIRRSRLAPLTPPRSPATDLSFVSRCLSGSCDLEPPQPGTSWRAEVWHQSRRRCGRRLSREPGLFRFDVERQPVHRSDTHAITSREHDLGARLPGLAPDPDPTPRRTRRHHGRAQPDQRARTHQRFGPLRPPHPVHGPDDLPHQRGSEANPIPRMRQHKQDNTTNKQRKHPVLVPKTRRSSRRNRIAGRPLGWLRKP